MNPPCSEDDDSDVPDAILLAEVRAGSTAAYARLYDRHHGAALRVATAVAGPAHAEDLVAEAFTRTLRLLLDGRGPDRGFRTYLYAAVRNAQNDSFKRSARQVPVADFGPLEHKYAEPDPWPDLVENQLVADALSTLPPRWQTVLRLTTIEDRPIEEAAALLGISPGAVAQLSFRAREALRIAYLTQHVPEPVADDCRTSLPQLARHVRTPSTALRSRAADHVVGCAPCTSARTELTTVAAGLHPAGRRA